MERYLCNQDRKTDSSYHRERSAVRGYHMYKFCRVCHGATAVRDNERLPPYYCSHLIHTDYHHQHHSGI